MTVYEFSRPSIPPLSPPSRRVRIFFFILLAHLLAIGGPLAWMWARGRLNPPKEVAFKVKLGDVTPSHAPVVGEPERLRPNAGKSSPPPEPEVKLPPKPKPRPVEPKVKLPPKPKPKPKPAEPKVKIPPKPKNKPAEPRVNVPKRTKPAVKPRSTAVRRPTTEAEAQSQVYRPAGGNNFNRNVKIGTRDAGQKKGPADNKTPQGGLTKDEEAYYASLKKFLDVKWVEPSRTHLGDLRPKATLELEISADGRVLNARIVEASGNVSMDESIRRLIKVLDRVPTPPDGALKILVQMEVK